MKRRITKLIYTLFILVGLCLSCSEVLEFAHRLSIDVTFPDQALDKQTCLYTIEELEENSNYELRVSYPAVIPTDFVLEVEESQGRISNRKLLNVEQLQWKAGSKSYIIKVRAHRTGVPINLKRLQDPVPFNIIVNRLYLGCSLATWKLITSIVFTIVLVLKFSLPRLLKMVDEMDHKVE
ncbi:uncharacterized protein [Clytia hemisphaerica]|uniref:uncharacterized protein n=1 Tax=Clytia hemisphaerica TaxID=252671 RepID=UPI0034D3E813|eukprot:TCONS_00022270-protein